MPVRRYDSPQHVRMFHGGRGALTSAGTNVTLPVYAKTRFVAAHAVVAVAGTSTAANNSLYTVRIGTDSVGAFAVGTQAAGITSSIGGSASPLGTATQYQVLNVLKQGGADGQIDVLYEYEVLPEGVLS